MQLAKKLFLASNDYYALHNNHYIKYHPIHYLLIRNS